MAVKQNLNSFSFVTASPFLCLRFSPDHQVADVSGRNPNRIRADADTLTCAGGIPTGIDKDTIAGGQ